MDGSSVDHHVDALYDVGGFLPVEDPGALLFQLPGERRLLVVRAGHGEMFLEKDLSQSAHADPADPDKMYMYRFVKLNMIHRFSPLFCKPDRSFCNTIRILSYYYIHILGKNQVEIFGIII